MSVVNKRVALFRTCFPSVVCEVTRIHAQWTVFVFWFRTKIPKKYDRESRKSSNVTRKRCSHWVVWNTFVANGSLRSLILSSSNPLNQSFDLETARACFSECFFPSLAFSESPRYEMCSIAPNKLHNNFKLSYAEGVSYVVQSSHLKIKRSSNLTGILPKTF